MQISEAYALVQHFLMYACLAALAALAIAVAFLKFAPVFDELWHKFIRLDGFGKVICSVGVVFMTLYGGSKSFFWNRVQHDGIDSGYSLVGIYTAKSNDVKVVSGQTITNEIPMAAVMTLNTPAPQSIDVSIRRSETNEWTTISKISPRYETEGTTNILAFITAQDYSDYGYWWAGSDRPAVIITSTDITIDAFLATSTYVRIDWSCEQPLATEFKVQWKESTNSVWTTAATVTANTATINGFWIGRTIDWRVISEYLEDGE